MRSTYTSRLLSVFIALAAQRALRFGFVADGFHVVAIRTGHEGAEVVGMIDLADAGGSVVLPAGRHRGCVKGFDLVTIVGNECNMHGALSLAAAAEPKFGLAALTESRISAYLDHQFYPQRRECTREK